MITAKCKHEYFVGFIHALYKITTHAHYIVLLRLGLGLEVHVSLPPPIPLPS